MATAYMAGGSLKAALRDLEVLHFLRWQARWVSLVCHWMQAGMHICSHIHAYLFLSTSLPVHLLMLHAGVGKLLLMWPKLWRISTPCEWCTAT